jgi:hypothetical protein
MKENALIFPEMNYAVLGYTSQLLGIEEQKDQKQYYKVQVNKGGDRKDIDYYDVQTGLKMRSETKGGLSEYSDYKAVDGIMFPFALTQSMGPQTFNLKVTGVKMNAKLQDALFEIK